MGKYIEIDKESPGQHPGMEQGCWARWREPPGVRFAHLCNLILSIAGFLSSCIWSTPQYSFTNVSARLQCKRIELLTQVAKRAERAQLLVNVIIIYHACDIYTE